MIRKLFILLFLICPVVLFSAYKPDRFYLNLESGFSFSTFTSLNSGIQNFGGTLEDSFGPSAAGKTFKDLNFDIPILLKAGLNPFSGKIRQKDLSSLLTGYMPTFSWNTIKLLDTTLEYDYTVGVIPVEIGAEFTFADFRFLGGKMALSAGVGFGYYRGKFSLGFTDSNGTSGIDTATYPREYAGRGAGALLSFNSVWKISDKFSVVSTLTYRYANITSLTARVSRSDGTTVEEQLYIGNDGFASAEEQPAGTTPAKINLSGLSIRFGIRYSFGTVRLTDIPEGLYR